MKHIKSLVFLIAALYSFYFSHKIFDDKNGRYIDNQTYGGDAFTGIQNAAATAARNAADTAVIVQDGFGYLLVVSGIALLGMAVPKDLKGGSKS